MGHVAEERRNNLLLVRGDVLRHLQGYKNEMCRVRTLYLCCSSGREEKERIEGVDAAGQIVRHVEV